MAARRDFPVGERAMSLLGQAIDDAGIVMIDWLDNPRICAMKRLVRDGLFSKQVLGGGNLGRAGKCIFYVITDKGRERFVHEQNRK